ncbi:MAG: DUF4249 family protein, partial [Nitrososphaeraceae archaeon]|nr:DUF4249 family protein [Nitrososphaeraceae archaeon]
IPDSLIPLSASPECYGMESFPPRFLHKVYNCWAFDYDEEYLQVQSDFAFNGRYVPDNEVLKMLVDRRFNDGYSMLISMQSMSENAFNYWSDISDQLGNNGTIFETANYQVVGNMRSADNPDETVLGYFTVSAEKSKRVFVADYIGDFGDINCYVVDGCWNEKCLDCETFVNNPQYSPPDFWPEEYIYDREF